MDRDVMLYEKKVRELVSQYASHIEADEEVENEKEASIISEASEEESDS